MSTGRKPFSILICLNAAKFVLLSVFTLIEKINLVQTFVQNHDSRVQKVHFWVACTAQNIAA